MMSTHRGIFAHLRPSNSADPSKYPSLVDLLAWERRLDKSFTELVETEPLLLCGFPAWDVSELVPWRVLVGGRFLNLDGLAIHVSLPSNHRARLLPSVAMNLAILGDELPYFDDWERCFLPCDDEIVCEWFAGLTVDLPDKSFHETLGLLDSAQRECIADFVDWHFGRYAIAQPDCAALTRAHEHLCKVWREA